MVHAAVAKTASLAPLLHQDQVPHTNLPPVNDDLPRNFPKREIRRFSRRQHTRTHVFANDRIGSSHFPLPYLSPEQPLVPHASAHESPGVDIREQLSRCPASSLYAPPFTRVITSLLVAGERAGRRPRGCSHPDASSGEVPQGNDRPGMSFSSWRFRRGTMRASRNLPREKLEREHLLKATAKTRKRGMTTAHVSSLQKSLDFFIASRPILY